MRFTQIGSITGEEIALPARLLGSSSIELLGSGSGSLSLGQMMAAAGDLFTAATFAGLALDHRVAPIAGVAQVWNAGESERIMFQIGCCRSP